MAPSIQMYCSWRVQFIFFCAQVVLIGRQGADEITFEELADKFGSVHTEINLSCGHMNTVEYISAPTTMGASKL